MRTFQTIESAEYIKSEQITADCKHLLKRTSIKEDEIKGFKLIFSELGYVLNTAMELIAGMSDFERIL